ncbi:tyrosine-protein kinase Dnt-like [Copidosoma floridanum]|uniref:tyrosine-protein kinase Dnt-like n=1 Tax=Copidosoma floridanum TaxID=29053 RepID=UPI0006C94604|nr:tyrosine-protein kinase Dnt-like [Copidosoma floridanum]
MQLAQLRSWSRKLFHARLKLVGLVLLLAGGSSDAYLNVFISQSQVNKLLGLDAELYYVRGGIINAYAMNFVVPVAANIDDLEFTWQSLAGQPLAYSLKIDYDMRGVTGYGSSLMALMPPKVNVSSTGHVPVEQQVFAIRLPCSGLESAEVKVAIKLNVTAPPETKFSDTILVFKRNKICMKGIRTQSKNDSVKLEAGPLANGNHAFYVAATCACALILVVVGVASIIYIRNSKARSQHPRKSLACCSYSAAGANGLAASSVLVKVDNRPGSANSGSYATIADLEPLYARPCGSRASYYAASHVTHLSQATDPCEKARAVIVPRAAMQCRSVVQEGTFGRIYRGTLSQAGREQEVIIKTVTDAASAYQTSLLVVEGAQLAGLVHGNVASLAASCLDSTAPMLAYACTPSDLNLKTYLTDGKNHPVTRDLVNIAVQVARAGAFLHGRGILHRDIATRNCLVDTSSLRTRLADAALSRDLFPQDYHCLGDNDNRPIGWMSLESLQLGQYSTASDAWSFGVFLWELATMGQQPYAEVDPFELAACLRDGYRLAQPRPCPDELFAVMAVCWLGPARDRPTMPQLLAYLQEFYDALGGYI